MFVVQPICQRNQPHVEAALAGLVAADQQDRDPARIESVEDPDRPAADLHAQFAHMAVPRPDDPA
jgi:hypothetical protein